MSGHTPGPWYVYRGEDGEAIAIQKFVEGDNGGTTGKGIARMPVPQGWGAKNARNTREEIDANARLIAAAPDSHEANLKIIAAFRSACAIDDDSSDDWIYDELGSVLSGAYFAARAAIAKATGAA